MVLENAIEWEYFPAPKRVLYSLCMRHVALILLLAFNASPADVATAVRTTFVDPWIKAVHTDTAAQLTRFLHPKVRACVNNQTRDFFEFDQLNLKDVTPKSHITKLAPCNQPSPLFTLPADGFAYPVQPTWELNLQDLDSDTVYVFFLAQAGNAWYIVVPCPNEKGMSVFRKMVAYKKTRDERIASLAAELKDPLRSELRELIKGGRIVDAAEKYKQMNGLEDVFIAIAVMKTIDK
jgi:hypothetical protein